MTIIDTASVSEQVTGDSPCGSKNEKARFCHKPLPDATTCIRLFEIVSGAPGQMVNLKLTIHRVPTTELEGLSTIKYTALSYMWGPPRPSREVLINGSSFSIRENLWNFVQQLAVDASGYLWADAICINQEDLEERNSQVSIMGSIYESALSVIAWVGPCTDETETEIVFSFANEWAQQKTEDDQYSLIRRYLEEGQDAFGANKLDALYSFCLLDYWKRTWIIQELSLARNTLVFCGSYRVSLDNLCGMYQSPIWENVAYKPGGAIARAGSQDFSLALLNNISRSGSDTLRVLLVKHGWTRCHEPRDKVYALRSIASDIPDNVLRPNYAQDIRDLYWQVLEICKSHRDGFEEALLRLLDISLASLMEHFEDAQHFKHLDYGYLFAHIYPKNSTVVLIQEGQPFKIVDKARGKELSLVETNFTLEGGWTGTSYADVQPGDRVYGAGLDVGPFTAGIIVSPESNPTTLFKGWALFRGGRWVVDASEALRQLKIVHTTCGRPEGIKTVPRGMLSNSSFKIEFILTSSMVIACLLFRQMSPVSSSSAAHNGLKNVLTQSLNSGSRGFAAWTPSGVEGSR